MSNKITDITELQTKYTNTKPHTMVEAITYLSNQLDDIIDTLRSTTIVYNNNIYIGGSATGDVDFHLTLNVPYGAKLDFNGFIDYVKANFNSVDKCIACCGYINDTTDGVIYGLYYDTSTTTFMLYYGEDNTIAAQYFTNTDYTDYQCVAVEL